MMKQIQIDWRIVLPSIFLSALGLLVLKSVAPNLVAGQFFFILLSAVFYLIFSSIDFGIMQSFSFFIYPFCVGLLLIPFLYSDPVRGSHRWIDLGISSVQPSEVLKPLLILTFSSIAASKIRNNSMLLTVAGLLPIIIVFLQPDLGTSLVIGIGWVTILLSKLNLRTIFSIVFLGLTLLIPTYNFALRDYQKDRIRTFINPYEDPLSRGYHVIQSIISVGSGQLLGRGLGHGTQSQLRFLPEHHTDFIFSALSEELGFVGSIVTLVLFILFLRGIYLLSQLNISPSASLFCLSVCGMISFQIFVNIGMNIGIAPITGITLPFMSYGGSSLLSFGIVIGILGSIYRSTKSHLP